MAAKKDDPNKPLTAKQQKAVDHYRIHGDKSAAYRHAYDCKNMSDRSIHRQAIALFKKPHVASCLQHARQVQAQKLDISENRVLAELAAMAFSNVANLYNENGIHKPIHDMDPATQRAIKKVKVKRYLERTGYSGDEEDFEEVELVEIELHAKQPALNKIMEIKGMAAPEDKNQHRPVNVNVNISGKSVKVEK